MLDALRPDTGSFSKLLVWLGIALIVAAFGLPWLFLRETRVLEISREKLATFTPQARETLIERQQNIDDLQDRGRWAPVVMLAGGVLLIGVGGWGLRSQQRVEDQLRTAARDKAYQDLKIEPQSEVEEEEELQVDAAVGAPHVIRDDADAEGPRAREAQTHSEAGLTSQAEDQLKPGATDADQRQAERIKWLEDLRRVETEVLDRIAGLTPPGYSFQPKVTVSRGAGATRLQLDALLGSLNPNRPDILVEVTRVGSSRSALAAVRRLVDQAIARTVSYRRLANRPAWMWLIVVAEDLPEEDVEGLQERLRDSTFEDIFGASVIRSPTELSALPQPPKQQM